MSTTMSKELGYDAWLLDKVTGTMRRVDSGEPVLIEHPEAMRHIRERLTARYLEYFTKIQKLKSFCLFREEFRLLFALRKPFPQGDVKIDKTSYVEKKARHKDGPTQSEEKSLRG